MVNAAHSQRYPVGSVSAALASSPYASLNPHGSFLLFTTRDSPRVSAGIVTSKTTSGTQLTVHEHRQSQEDKRKFTPVYKNVTTGRLVWGTGVPGFQDEPAEVTLSAAWIISCGFLQDSYVDSGTLAVLQSRGMHL